MLSDIHSYEDQTTLIMGSGVQFLDFAATFIIKGKSGEFAKIVVTFEERPGGSWVKFYQYGELPEEHIPMAKAGMESYFQSLADFLGE